ncbi:predicted protein [Histoplasma capsulatum H143]|uniref:Uncharacterized protein n=1 Tax=Ajellomyces capsulatus (strain H143) TaxID=544712 RepID=C6HB45_AJECH|nr:predicted protein [Histoplasma capsulatum H143]
MRRASGRDTSSRRTATEHEKKAAVKLRAATVCGIEAGARSKTGRTARIALETAKNRRGSERREVGRQDGDEDGGEDEDEDEDEKMYHKSRTAATRPGRQGERLGPGLAWAGRRQNRAGLAEISGMGWLGLGVVRYGTVQYDTIRQ